MASSTRPSDSSSLTPIGAGVLLGDVAGADGAAARTAPSVPSNITATITGLLIIPLSPAPTCPA
ncbi:MAG: hypothetical protein ACHP7I_00395 [Terriglobales bacterium]